MSKKKFLSKKVKALSLGVFLVGAIFISQTKVSAAALPGSMTVSVAKSTFSTGEGVVINWKASIGATKYGLTVRKAPYNGDKNVVWDHYVTGASKNIGKLPAGSYLVRMMPYNSAGSGAVSNTVYFTVAAPATAPKPTPAPTPATASKPAPAPVLPGAMKVSVKTTFKARESVVIKWSKSTNTTKYGLSIWKEPYTGYPVWDHYVTGTSKRIGILAAGSYRVIMKPYNSTGGGANSNIVYFTVKSAVPAVSAPSISASGKKKEDAWFKTAVGRKMNPDKVYGLQCVDVADDYSNAIFKPKSYKETIGAGDAGALFDIANPKYFTKITNNPNDPNLIPQHGDIIVWPGHIAVVDSSTTSGLTVLQQNRHDNNGNPVNGGATERFTNTWKYYYTYNGNAIGWLRPKL